MQMSKCCLLSANVIQCFLFLGKKEEGSIVILSSVSKSNIKDGEFCRFVACYILLGLFLKLVMRQKGKWRERSNWS